MPVDLQHNNRRSLHKITLKKTEAAKRKRGNPRNIFQNENKKDCK